MGIWVWEDEVGTPARAEPLRAWWPGLESLLPTEDTRALRLRQAATAGGRHLPCTQFLPPLFWLQSFCE